MHLFYTCQKGLSARSFPTSLANLTGFSYSDSLILAVRARWAAAGQHTTIAIRDKGGVAVMYHGTGTGNANNTRQKMNYNSDVDVGGALGSARGTTSS